MANPQLEDGYTAIANDCMDALMRTNFPGHERRVLDCILRKTYGWHKKSDRISFSQFEEATHIDRRNIARSVHSLIARNIVTCAGKGYSLEYSFQKDYEQWDKNIVKSDNKLTSKDTTIKRKKLPESNGNFEEFLQQKAKEYPELNISAEWEACKLWYSEGKKQILRPKSALNNWLRIAREKAKRGNNANRNPPFRSPAAKKVEGVTIEG